MRLLLFGTFDRLHPGHLCVLQEAARRSTDVHIVVARDHNVLRIKGRMPVQNEQERLRAVQNAVPEAHVFLGDPEDFVAPIRTVKPDLILLGYDQKLPPGIAKKDLLCPIERLPPFEPERYKSSLLGDGSA